ncbi:MAG: hypothetical protein P1P84_12395 [Deferrisomatales bacterium]|nr:hypothetical protein [Deferrisomatales bacterium]
MKNETALLCDMAMCMDARVPWAQEAQERPALRETGVSDFGSVADCVGVMKWDHLNILGAGGKLEDS